MARRTSPRCRSGWTVAPRIGRVRINLSKGNDMNEMERAAVSAFGLDPDKVRSVALTASAAGLSLQVVIPIDADDYLAIADRMRALREPAAAMPAQRAYRCR